MSQKQEFVEFMCRSISEIPQDVKILFEMLDDAELSESARTQTAGALLYLLAPGDLIPDTFGLLGHADDSLVFRMIMAANVRGAPQERAEHYRGRYPEVFDTLDEDLATAVGFLGEMYPWMEQWLDKLDKVEFKGKRAPAIIADVEEGTWLYDEVNEALLDVDFDEDDLRRELRRVDRILPVMREKMEASRR